MTRPLEAPRDAHIDDGISWHVMCYRCPEVPARYSTMPVHVCKKGCYPDEAEANHGRRRHQQWHDRRGDR